MEELGNSMRVLRLKQVEERTGLSRSCVYDKLNQRSPRHDPTFPTPFKIGLSAVGWDEVELNRWLTARKLASRGGNNA